MPDYQEAQVTGKKWRRCHGINISNPSAPGTPSIVFQEQDVISIDGVNTIVGGEFVSAGFDPKAEIELVNPATLEPLGQTISEGTIYLALFSKYIATAKARDEFSAKAKAALESLNQPTEGQA